MKKRSITKEEARAYAARWQLVNAAEREELRATPMALKLRQFASLMGLAKQLGGDEARAAEEDEVRERWKRLRKAYGV